MNILGALLRVAGVLFVPLSPFILFFGIEPLIGMESIVGRENVIRDEEGFGFTNPLLVWFWIFCIALTGVLLWLAGGALIKRAERQTIQKIQQSPPLRRQREQ